MLVAVSIKETGALGILIVTVVTLHIPYLGIHLLNYVVNLLRSTITHLASFANHAVAHGPLRLAEK